LHHREREVADCRVGHGVTYTLFRSRTGGDAATPSMRIDNKVGVGTTLTILPPIAA
jgi:hypothetical protein